MMNNASSESGGETFEGAVSPRLHVANEYSCACCSCTEGRQTAAELTENSGEPQPKTTGGYTGEGSASTNDYLSALVSGYSWDNSSPITYHLQYSDANNNGTDDWQENGAGAAIRLAFDLISQVADIDFEEVASASDANLVESVVPSSTWTNSSVLGDHYFPNSSDVANGRYNIDGFGWSFAGLQQGGYGFVTLIHEIGHGLGLEHPHDGDVFRGVSNSGNKGDFGLNQGVYTTMSYIDGYDGDGSGFNSAYGWQGSMMAFDIAALQQIYGANSTHASGNDTYVLPNSNGSGTFYQAIWDTGGTDTLVYNGSAAATLDLTAATIDHSSTGGGVISRANGVYGGFTIAQGVVIENATGGSGRDLITGNGANNILTGNGGNDTINGLGGADTLNGGAGNDVLDGGAGVDTYLGGAGNDTLIVGHSDFAAGSEQLDGGSGFDTIRIQESSSGTHVFNFRDTSVDSIEAIDFADNGSSVAKTFLVKAEQFVEGAFSLDMQFEGSVGIGAHDRFHIAMYRQDTIDLSGFSFTNWGEQGFNTDWIAVYGDASSETVIGTSVADLMYLGAGIDNADGGDGRDNIHGGAGNDTLRGGDGLDSLYGDDGHDIIYGGAITDYIRGGDGNDLLYADTGYDRLFGQNGNDTLIGGSGRNQLYGGTGDDQLTGGTGRDQFVFQINAGNDTIQDWSESEGDMIAFWSLANVSSMSDLSITYTGGNAVIAYGDATITLIGITSGLGADDFNFNYDFFA